MMVKRQDNENSLVGIKQGGSWEGEIVWGCCPTLGWSWVSP